MLQEHLHTFDQAVHLAGLQTKPELSGLPARSELKAFSKSARAGVFDHLDSRWYELGELGPARLRFIRDHPMLCVARLPWIPRMRLAVSALLKGRRTKR